MCRSSPTRGSLVTPVLNGILISLRSTLQWQVQAPVALSRTSSPTRSVHRRHPRCFCFRSRRRRAVHPCLVRRERGRGFQWAIFYLKYCIIFKVLVFTTKSINAPTITLLTVPSVIVLVGRLTEPCTGHHIRSPICPFVPRPVVMVCFIEIVPIGVCLFVSSPLF